MLKLVYSQKILCLATAIIFLLIGIDSFDRSKSFVGAFCLAVSALCFFVLLSDPTENSKVEKFLKSKKVWRTTGIIVGVLFLVVFVGGILSKASDRHGRSGVANAVSNATQPTKNMLMPIDEFLKDGGDGVQKIDK